MTLNVSGMSNMHKNASMITHPGMSFEQELEYDDDMGESFSDEQPQQPLQRKLSMSKPTDLDELMRLQEQVSISPTFYAKHLRAQIPKAKKVSQVDSTFLCFWDLGA